MLLFLPKFLYAFSVCVHVANLAF